MAKQQAVFRPYAALSNVLAVIERARSRNLPETINNDFLRVTGIPDVVFGRVMQVLHFLNLVHEDGRPSDKFEALAGATDAQYRELLETIVREAYRNEFNIVDPGKDPQPRIVDAFQPYQPRSQTNRMVMLFLGLCREAGIPVLDAPRERRMKESLPKRGIPSREKRSIGVPSKPAFSQTRERTTVMQGTGGLLFGITEEDVAILNDDEFNEVWEALGRVARARARARKQIIEEETSAQMAESEEQKEQSAD